MTRSTATCTSRARARSTPSTRRRSWAGRVRGRVITRIWDGRRAAPARRRQRVRGRVAPSRSGRSGLAASRFGGGRRCRRSLGRVHCALVYRMGTGTHSERGPLFGRHQATPGCCVEQRAAILIVVDCVRAWTGIVAVVLVALVACGDGVPTVGQRVPVDSSKGIARLRVPLSARRDPLIVAAGDRAVVFGGFRIDGSQEVSLDAYDTAANAWAPMTGTVDSVTTDPSFVGLRAGPSWKVRGATVSWTLPGSSPGNPQVTVTSDGGTTTTVGAPWPSFAVFGPVGDLVLVAPSDQRDVDGVVIGLLDPARIVRSASD